MVRLPFAENEQKGDIVRYFLTGILFFALQSCGKTQSVAQGQRFDFTDALQLDESSGQFAQLFVPDYFQSSGDYDLVFHLHSATWAAENELYKAKANAILFNIHLGAFSSPYQAYFSSSAHFQEILQKIDQTLKAHAIVPDSAECRFLIVTSFSAGYAGVREMLKNETYFQAIDAIHLADGLHASDNKDLMKIQMSDFVRFARLALKKEKIFRLTHSSIPTSGYQSTTQTANYLLEQLGLTRRSVSIHDEIGSMYSRCDSGNFHLRGYLGDTAEDHLKHLYAMHSMLKATWNQLSNFTGMQGSSLSGVSLIRTVNFPNPFNEQTQIRFYLSRSSLVKLTIFNVLGEKLTTLLNARRGRGWHSVTWDAAQWPSGKYFYSLVTERNCFQGAMLLLK